jgi:hypothetical protein
MGDGTGVRWPDHRVIHRRKVLFNGFRLRTARPRGHTYMEGGVQEIIMRVFTLSVIAALLLGTAAWFGLGALQESSADAFATSSTRLDQQEAVDFYGRVPG